MELRLYFKVVGRHESTKPKSRTVENLESNAVEYTENINRKTQMITF